MKILNATVKFPAGKVFENRFGKSQNAKAILDNGTEITIWCKADEPNEIQKWRKDERVQVIEDGGKYKPVETEKPFPVKMTKNEMAETDRILSAAQMIEPQPQRKKEIMRYVEFQKRMYHHIFNEVSDEMKDLALKDELLKDIATTLFIQTNKKFSL